MKDRHTPETKGRHTPDEGQTYTRQRTDIQQTKDRHTPDERQTYTRDEGQTYIQ